MLEISRIDHLVLTVKSIQRTTEFYTQVLGMQAVTFGDNRKALLLGQQKINLHEYGKEFEPKAACAAPGSADICFIVTQPLGDVMQYLQNLCVEIKLGPVQRTGALGPIESLYIRDPDDNLLELSRYVGHNIE